MEDMIQEITDFLEKWEDTPEQNKKAFIHLLDYLRKKKKISLDFLPRPGVTYSLRATHKNQKDKPLFVLVDVIEDQPRWLSVCFYGDMISDPDEKGDYVPEGLLGEDATCFDLESYNEEDFRYVEKRIDEAFESASRS
ncbi:MAG: hypothetical protein R6U27_08980 [Desulfobacterales bacterium]